MNALTITIHVMVVANECIVNTVLTTLFSWYYVTPATEIFSLHLVSA